MSGKLLTVFALILFCTAGVSAQESADQSIDRLTTEIARRETIDRDENTPAEQRITNRANLENARTALLKAVQAKLTAMQKYLDTLSDSITPEEKQDARAALRKLAEKTNDIANGSGTISAPREAIVLPTRAPAANSVAPPTSNSAANQAAITIEILSPLDHTSTEDDKIDVVVQLDSAAAANVEMKWTVTTAAGNVVKTGTFVISTGRLEADLKNLPLQPGDNQITVELVSDSSVNSSITVNSTASADTKTAFTRAIIGVEQAAAASAKPEQKLFLEFNLTAPLFAKDKNPLEAPVWLWLNPRITSLPTPLTSTVAEFSTASNFLTPFNEGKVNEIVQGFEFLGGIEFKLGHPFGAIPSGFGKETKVRFGFSLVAAAGMSTPFGTEQVAPQFFKVNSTVTEAFPGAKDKEFIAFVTADRNRFFRQYYGGLRLKSYYVKGNHPDELENIFPGIIDLTFGQNETVTGGNLHGGVVRIDGIYPLPFAKGIYVFGSALMKLSKPKIPPPIILQVPETAPEFPSDKVFIQQAPPRDADHYRIGVGVDLIRLLKRN